MSMQIMQAQLVQHDAVRSAWAGARRGGYAGVRGPELGNPSARVEASQFTLRAGILTSKVIVTRTPLPGAVSILRSVCVFSCKVCTIRAPIFPGTGHTIPTGRPAPSF